jgi:hypothetical protein
LIPHDGQEISLAMRDVLGKSMNTTGGKRKTWSDEREVAREMLAPPEQLDTFTSQS